MKYRPIVAIIVLSMMTFIGCNTTSEVSTEKDTEAVSRDVAEETGDTEDSEVDADVDTDESNPNDSASSQVIGTYDGDDILVQEQEDAIMAYFDRYYEGLSQLTLLETEDLFAGDSNLFAPLHEAAWDYMIQVRQMQDPDLTMEELRYRIYNVQIQEAEEARSDEGVSISLLVDEDTRFNAYPDVIAHEYGIRHYFNLIETDDGWALERHLQRGTLYWQLFGENYQREFLSGELAVTNQAYIRHFQEEKETLLAKARQNMEDWRREGVLEELATDHEYKREAAIDYALQWINTRNDDWFDYTNYGGNCQNFASQAMLAGGIPMDTVGAQWKWYGTEPNSRSEASGRSPAWTGVGEFYDYASVNSGFGLSATVNAPFWEGDIGDIIILGYDDNWRHTVMITDIVRDDSGQVVDYLIASNTSNQEDYPISAYLYTRRELIKIHGWNDPA